jgi:alpha-L-rhamnosidase
VLKDATDGRNPKQLGVDWPCTSPDITMKTTILAFALLSFLAAHADGAGALSSVTATKLRCESSVSPLGVDVPCPRLSWILNSQERAQRQTAFEILLASSPESLSRDEGDLWESGKTKSNETIQIPYAGKPLKSSQQVFWKVRVWDKEGKVSGWSEPASWTMGLLAEIDWHAKWIGATDTNIANLLLRREFIVKPGLKRAVAHVCGLGQYELFVNGRKSGDELLTPGWTAYDKTCLYDTHDVTALLQSGANVLGLSLGDGMYRVISGGRYAKFTGSFGPQKAIAQLQLEYADGSVEIIGTDKQWRASAGPISFLSVYGGEDYDARLEQTGWNASGFDASKWRSAEETSGPGGALKGLSCAAPTFHKFEVLKPTGSQTISNGVTVYDLGQNVSLMARLRAHGPRGAAMRIIPAELVRASGAVDRGSAGGGKCWWEYTLSGSGSEEWCPQFFYHGSRYLQVECRPASEGGELPVVESIEGVVVHSASEPVGEFECSNALFNRIRKLIRWAQRSNLASVITDCPHRERLGWLEQYHLNGPSLRYEFDLARMFTKGMNDMEDAQMPNGFVPNIAPEYTVFGRDRNDFSNAFRDSPEWGSAFILVPWQQYEFTGDVELLRRHYDAMKRYVDYLGSRSTHHIVNHGLGDWYDIGPRPPGIAQLTPKALTATAFYFCDVDILTKTAALLGKRSDAKQFRKLAEEIRVEFNKNFFNATNGTYATGSQCANAIPLVMGIVEPANRTAVLDAIVRDVRGRGNAITAGDVGYRYLLRGLAEGGRSDVIFDMNNQSEKPGYGYQLKMGATSLTEAWNARRSSSQNHFMLGQIIEWFYGDLAGIAPDPAGPGFKRILIKPEPVGDVRWARASFDSVRGEIVSDWKRSGDTFTLRVVIPANTTATVVLPAKSARQVTEGGKSVSKAPGVKLLRENPGRAVFEIESGNYEFKSTL